MMDDETAQLALATAEAIARDPNARQQDRISAARLLAQLRGELDLRGLPRSGGSIVTVVVPEFCSNCGARNTILAEAERHLGGPIRLTDGADEPEPARLVNPWKSDADPTDD
jgi:hypothetical protein